MSRPITTTIYESYYAVRHDATKNNCPYLAVRSMDDFTPRLFNTRQEADQHHTAKIKGARVVRLKIKVSPLK